MMTLCLLFGPLMLVLPTGRSYVASMVACCTVAVLSIVTARRGRVGLGVVIFLVNYILTIVANVAWTGDAGAGPLFCLLIVTLAGALLGPGQVAIVYVVAMAVMAALPLAATHTVPLGYLELTLCVALVSAFTVIIAAATSLDIRRALHAAVAVNEILEARVIERTAQLEELTVRDPLTGLHNRRHLAHELPRLLTAADRVGAPLFLAAAGRRQLQGHQRRLRACRRR